MSNQLTINTFEVEVTCTSFLCTFIYFSGRTRQCGLVFGLSLEKCIDNDQTCNKPPTTDAQAQGRVSRNSISSLGDNNVRNVSITYKFEATIATHKTTNKINRKILSL